MTTTTEGIPMEEPRTESRYIDVTETAKLIRTRLRAEFPGVKFSVRSSRYAGGASIDGMIDMAYSVEHWLNPDGTATLAHSPGTEGSRGCDPEHFGSRRHPDAELVHFGANYVFTHRKVSDEFVARVAERARFDRLTGANQRCDSFRSQGCAGWVKGEGLHVEIPSRREGTPNPSFAACSQECAAEIVARFTNETEFDTADGLAQVANLPGEVVFFDAVALEG